MDRSRGCHISLQSEQPGDVDDGVKGDHSNDVPVTLADGIGQTDGVTGQHNADTDWNAEINNDKVTDNQHR